MSTLERWQHLMMFPQTIICPKMELNGRDHEPSVVVGHGELRFQSNNLFEYRLWGKPADEDYARRMIERQKLNPYDGLMRFRLVATDAKGIEYAAGYTIPHVEVRDEYWIFSGDHEGIIFDDAAVPKSDAGSTELQILVPKEHQIYILLANLVSSVDPDGNIIPEYKLKILQSELIFRFDADRGHLFITADGTRDFPLTYTERWLSEPLRILFGQLIFPRLTARNLPNGGAIIFVTRSPFWSRYSDWIGLWSGLSIFSSKDTFWQTYADLLQYVMLSGDDNWERSQITRLYEEIIQASYGSRWISALTLASGIENLVRVITPRGTKRHDANHDEIKQLSDYIEKYPKKTGLKGAAISAIKRTAEATPRYGLKQLSKDGVSKPHVSAWEKVRNEVTHGVMVSPYSNEEEDDLVFTLSDLFHVLTRIIGKRTLSEMNIPPIKI